MIEPSARRAVLWPERLARAARARHRHLDQLGDPSRIGGEDEDTVGEQHGFVEVVRDEDDCDVDLAPDLEQVGLHPRTRLRVQGRERLVHEQDARPHRQRPGDRHALLHATGELMRVGIGEFIQADQREPFARLALGGAAAFASLAQTEHHVLQDAEPGEERVALEHHAEIGAGPMHRRAVDKHDARAGVLQSRKNAHERRLAAARWTYDAEQLAAMRHHIDAA